MHVRCLGLKKNHNIALTLIINKSGLDVGSENRLTSIRNYIFS
jgi:hypothetical protein